MFEFEKPKIEIVEISDDNKYGKFVVEPLERGYGITLGNSLRRIMLSSEISLTSILGLSKSNTANTLLCELYMLTCSYEQYPME